MVNNLRAAAVLTAALAVGGCEDDLSPQTCEDPATVNRAVTGAVVDMISGQVEFVCDSGGNEIFCSIERGQLRDEEVIVRQDQFGHRSPQARETTYVIEESDGSVSVRVGSHEVANDCEKPEGFDPDTTFGTLGEFLDR
jgi:hypothetical protein